jgi:hypothetical protein
MLWDLNAAPFNAIVRNTGFWSLRFLCLTLAITPLRWLTGWHSLVKFRRMMGLWGFFYGMVHTAAYVVFNRIAELDASLRTQPFTATAHTLSAIGVDLQHPFFAIGLVALVLLAPLAATSTAGMIRWLWRASLAGVAPARVSSGRSCRPAHLLASDSARAALCGDSRYRLHITTQSHLRSPAVFSPRAPFIGVIDLRTIRIV